ncbi:MAG: histidine kinase [Deltaproteobacteria bacterium]|nr:histidine kinase [Deltaproteobacteria bacterium]
MNFALGAAVLCLVGTLAWITWQRRLARRWLDRLVHSVRRYARGEDRRLAVDAPPPELESLSLALDDLVRALGEEASGMRSELRLEQEMVRQTPNGLVLVDAEGRVRMVNPAARVLLPVRGDPTGRPPIDAIPLAELQDVIDECREKNAIAERSVVYGPRDLVVRGLPLDGGRAALGVVLDITTVRAAERARRDFVSNVSHELRTPITTIVGFAEALGDEPLPESSRPMVEAIQRNARRLHALVDDVLHLSRIESRGEDLACEVQPLRPLVDEVVQRIGPRAEARRQSLVVDGPDLEASINADAFVHALGNLVDNAVKYTPEGGHVAVRLATAGHGVEVSVIDDGPGIDPVHHPRLFERFYRVDPGRSRDVGGTGLGLALVKHLCQAMRAEVSVKSAPGEGSCFVIRLRP